MSVENSQECSNIIRDEVRGEYICADTGEVLSDHIILELPPYQNESSYHTTRINKLQRIEFKRLLELDKKTRTSSYLIRKLSVIFNRYASKLSLPKCVKLEAWKIINKAITLNYRKTKKQSFVLACIYIACNRHNYPIDLNTLKQLDYKAAKDLYKNIKMITEYLKISLKPLNPTQLIPSLVSALNLPDIVVYKSSELLAEVSKDLVLSRSRRAYAIASVYIMSLLLGRSIRQADIRIKTGVGEMTIRNAAKDILNKMDSIEFICSKCNNVVGRVTMYKELIPTINSLYYSRPICKYCNRSFPLNNINIEIKNKKIKVLL